MSRELEDLFRQAHNIYKTAQDCTEANSLAQRLLVEELESWMFQWIQKVYEAVFSRNELTPCALSDQDLFRGVNFAVLKNEPVGEFNVNVDHPLILQISQKDVRFSCENSCRSYNLPTQQHKKLPSGRPTKFPEMEQELCEWISFSHSAGQQKNLTQYKIIQKAKEIQKLLYPGQQFTGSKGWFERFGNRNPQFLKLTLKHGRPRYIERNKEQLVKKIQKRNYKAGQGKSFSQGGKKEENQNRSSVFIKERLKEEIDQIFLMDEESLSWAHKHDTKNQDSTEIVKKELSRTVDSYIR